MNVDINTIFILMGILVNTGVLVGFLNRLEHRLTKTETNIIHIMRKCGMLVREDGGEI